MTDAPWLYQGPLPPGVPTPTFDPTADQLIDAWMQTDARRVLLLFGELDPWGALTYPTDAAREIVEYRVPNFGGYWEGSITSLAPADRAQAEALVLGWMTAP